MNTIALGVGYVVVALALLITFWYVAMCLWSKHQQSLCAKNGHVSESYQTTDIAGILKGQGGSVTRQRCKRCGESL